MPLTLSAQSLEYVRVAVRARENGVDVDPTADTVEIAFTEPGIEPGSGDWTSGDWETDTTTAPDTYLARILVGTGGDVELQAGRYDTWVRITDNPEIPVKRAGVVVVTGTAESS